MNNLAHGAFNGKPEPSPAAAFGDVVGGNTETAKSDDQFRRLWGLGYHRLVPIVPPDAKISEGSTLYKKVGTPKDARGKTPGIRGTNGLWFSFDWTNHEADETDLIRWHAMGAGVGIKTGDLCNGFTLLAIDADTTDAGHGAIVQEVLDRRFGTLPLRIGRPPKGAYVALVRGPFPYARIEFGERDANGRLIDRVEILSDGRQFVAHGIHPKTGRPYRWERVLPPIADLPVLDGDEVLAALEEMRQLLPQASELQREGGRSAGPVPNQESLRGELAHVRRAVEAMPNRADDDRNFYVAVGYAIKAAVGPENEAEGLALFEDWASRWEGGGSDVNLSGNAEADWRRMSGPYRRGSHWLFEEAEKRSAGTFDRASI